MAEEELVAALAVRTAMGSQEATPAAEARMVAEAAMEVLKVAQQALTPCQARNNADGQGAVSWRIGVSRFWSLGGGARPEHRGHTVRLLR